MEELPHINLDFCRKYRLNSRSIAMKIKKDIMTKNVEMGRIREDRTTEIEFDLNKIAEEMGPEFIGKHPAQIYWGLRYGFYSWGLTPRRHGKDKVIVRLKRRDDILPVSLRGCQEERDMRKRK